MKHSNIILLVLVLLMPLARAGAEEVTIDGIIYYYEYNDYGYYDYSNSEASVIGYEEGITDAVILGSVNGHIVTRISSYAFSGCSTLQSIVISEGVTSIGNVAFRDCRNLKTVTFPEGLTKIEELAFVHCSGLTSITIPKGLKILGGYAFSGCTSLTTVSLPDGLESIGRHAFYECSNLTTINIPEGVTSIGYNAFYECSSLASIDLPSSLTEIDYYAFYGCSSLESVVIPEKVKYLDFGVFDDCNKLRSVTLPNAMTVIDGSAFRGCNSLKSITLPDSLESLGERTFYGCDSLMSIVIPEKVTSLPKELFYECSNLNSVILPEGLTIIGDDAFYKCYSLSSIHIPNKVISIGESAFYGCESMKYVNIPDRVYKIENFTFYSCSSLNSVVLPDGLKSIGRYAFTNCNLDSISIPFNISEIDESGFRSNYLIIRGNEIADYDVFNVAQADYYIVDGKLYNQYLTSQGWKKIGDKLFTSGMFTLKTVDLVADANRSALYSTLGDSAKYIANLKIKGSINGYDIMALRNKTSHLLYLDLSEASILANDGGYEYYTGCSIEEDNALGKRCFFETRLINISLPNSLRKIDDYSFGNCSYLEKITIPAGVESIGKGAFSYCKKLKEADLPKSLLSIGDEAFYTCESLGPNVIIPDKLESVSSSCFYGCQGIDSVHIGFNVLEIGWSTFYGCYNIRKISFNRKITEIGSYAFCGCSSLLELPLPYSLEHIGYEAFGYCSSLKSVKIPSLAKEIGPLAFWKCDNIKSVYTYTIEPTKISQQTFSCYYSATLYVPKAGYNKYSYDTQWSNFVNVEEFDEPYDAFYLNEDLILDDETGRLDGVPDAEMFATAGLVVKGNSTQELKDVELVHDGTDGATIIGAADDLTGNQVNLTAKSLKVNISVEGNRWYFFCFPFNVELDSLECTTDYVLYSYNGKKRAGGNVGWESIAPTETILIKGVGYIFRASRTGILSIHVGSEYLNFTANTEDLQLRTYPSADATNASWNLIGNPFISYYDVKSLAEEYDAPIIVWNGYGYDAYRPGDDEDYQLKPFEAFFVQKENGKTQVEFLPENRLTHSQSLERVSQRAKQRAEMGTPISPDRQLVNITIMDRDSVRDRTRIVYSTKASMDYEIGVDAAKFQSDGVPQIYTLAGGFKYAINERPMGGDDINLGYIAPKAGVYTLSVPRQDAEIEIYDNVAQTVVDFTFGDYTFESNAGTFNNRFVVRMTGGVTAVEGGFRLDGLTVVAVDGGIDIEGQLNGKVSVYSESGILLAEPTETGRLELGDGTYIIKIGDKSIKLNLNRGVYAL